MELNPRNLVIGLVVIGAFFWWKCSGMFASMPAITSAGTGQIVVGAGTGDQTRYRVGSDADFDGAVVSYDVGAPGFLSGMGARAMLGFANSDTFSAAAQRAQRCRTCLYSQLGNNIMTLVLIPRDEAALKEMKGCHLSVGSHFHIAGQHLALQSMTHNGQSGQVNFGNTGIFLVSSISATD
jgi:hypothetical protein